MKITERHFKYETQWSNDKGQLHREDGPAIICKSGTKFWYQNGLLHREDGPAVEYADGDNFWYFNGNLNRFSLDKLLKLHIENSSDAKTFIINNAFDLDPGETFLLRLVIKNHFPDYLDFLDKLLILQ